MRNKKLWLKDQFDKHSSKLYGVAIRYFEQGNASNLVERTFLEALKREMLIEEDCFLFLRGILLEKIIEEIPRVKFDCKVDDLARDDFDLIDNLTVDTDSLVAELADVPDLGSGALIGMRVRVSPRLHFFLYYLLLEKLCEKTNFISPC